MNTLILTLAGRTFRVSHRYDRIRSLAEEFLHISPDGEATSALPLLSVTDEDLDAEQARHPRRLPADYLETYALERCAAEVLALDGVLHMHAVAVAVETAAGREAYVFLADSGVGKSTHAAAWRMLLGTHAVILCDDKPFLSFEDDRLLVHGSPWRGKEQWGINASVPVRAFGLLARGEEDTIRPATQREASDGLFAHTLLPTDPLGASVILAQMDRILKTVPIWHLTATPTTHAAEVAYSIMSKKE